MTFRPAFWPTIFTLPTLAVLLGLAVWQLDRMEWKAGLIEERRTRAAGPAIELPADERVPVSDLLNRPVTVTGRYMHEAEMRLLNRVRHGTPGVHLVTPLLRSDAGPTVLVDRGWAPTDWQGAHRGNADEVVVEGIVRAPPEPGLFTPDNRPQANEWYFLDPVQMAASAGVLPFPDFYIYATAEAPARPAASGGDVAPARAQKYPVANEWSADLPNDHLSYAITWFALAGALLVIYVMFHVTRHRAA